MTGQPSVLARPRLGERFGLEGKTVIVTGASSGLGAAFATGLAELGADVVICARRTDRLDETRQRVQAGGRRCVAVTADVCEPDDCGRVVAAAMDAFGQVSVLVNNAGVAAARPATRERPDEFRRVIETNLNGAYWMAQACGRVMRPGSSVVNVSSIVAFTTVGLPQAAYISSKAGLIGLTRDLAQQWTGRKGIRVNAVAPGFFDTEMSNDYPEGFNERILARIPAARTGDPDELVGAVAFLASDAASYISGAILPVDGGLLTR
jgi:NAD(P)-dependent dehydrogenase (short-subunit alcohol dehydrogenase family)